MKQRFMKSESGMAKIWGVLLVLLLAVIAVGLGALAGTFLGNFNITHPIAGIREAFSPPFDGKNVVHILALGEDNKALHATKDTRGLTDTIILMSVNMGKNSIAAMSIYRDTRIELPGSGAYGKINSAYSQGGAYFTEEAVYKLTGIRPDYYIKTNVDGFKKIVDILGGVEIDVEKNMRYDDNWGNLHINLKKGRQMLDGEKAMQYVRFRHDALGDITRIQRQQKFIKAIAQKSLAPENLPKLPRVMSEVMKNVETDMLTRDLVALAKLGSKVGMDRVKMGAYPATPQNIGGVSYMIPDTAKGPELVQELFFNYIDPTLPTVEVLNGSGREGAAKIVADALKREGYEVLNIGNADSYDYRSSQVITRKQELKGIDKLAQIVGPSETKQKETPEAKVGVTVIVGKDCTLLNLVRENTY